MSQQPTEQPPWECVAWLSMALFESTKTTTGLRGYMRDVDSKDVLFTQNTFPTAKVYTKRHTEWHVLGGDHPFWGQEYVEAWEGAAVSYR